MIKIIRMYLEQTEDAKKTAGNLSSSLLVRIIRYPFLAIYVIVIPRLLGASDYGKLAFVISIIMLSQEILTLGIYPVFGRYFPEFIVKKENKKLEGLLSAYLILEFVIGIVLALVVIVLYLIIQPQDKDILSYLIIYSALISEIYSGIFFSVLFGLNYVGKSNVINLFRTVFRLVFLLTFYPLFGFTGALLALLLTPILSGFYAYYSFHKVLKFRIQKPVINEFIPKLKFGIFIYTPTLLFLFQQQIGPIFLKSFSFSNNEIGFYDLANQGFLVLWGLAAASFDVLIPISSKFQTIEREEKGIDWLFMLLRYILPIFLIIISGFYLFGKGAIVLILGQEYIQIYSIALIVLSSIPIWVIGQLGYVRAVSLSKAKPYLISTVYSTTVFIIFGIFLVNNWGAKGVAIDIF
ncbi:MAG: oligosaccharide flippase family protein, partial [Ignavibacteriaceae bacterium]